jgi:hypothetical protein
MIVDIDIQDVPVGTVRPHRLLHRFFMGGGPAGYANFALLENLIRLTENAAFEFMQGKAAVLRLWSDKDRSSVDIGSALQASTHFEACLSDTHRALNHIIAARSRCDVLPASRHKLPPGLSIYKGTLRDQIREMRSAIQHKEDRILKGRISQGEPFAAHATGDEVPTADNNTLKTINRIELGPHRIEFTTLAGIITELRTCAEILVDAEYGPPGP